MTKASTTVEDDTRDNAADQIIQGCLSLTSPQSFFLYAGAGSGKTRSLKNALEFLLDKYGDTLRRLSRRVAVITYTNAACDEILRRVKRDPIFHVSTIHSFAWTLIEGRTQDISQWLYKKLSIDIEKNKDKLSQAKTSKSKNTYQQKITSLKERRKKLENITLFTYNPNGDNFGRDALSHGEVITMSSDFLTNKPTLQKIVLGRYPFLLIDESQDTLNDFMQALLKFEKRYKYQIALGLFGDTMQRIYPHGKKDLAHSIPDHWKRPIKQMNHRSQERIIQLANCIRKDVDDWSQLHRVDKAGGHVAAFVLPTNINDQSAIESKICENLSERTGDSAWCDPANVKTLVIEHHMAADRLGFMNIFSAIDPVKTLRTGFRDGSLAPLRLFTGRILPLVEASQKDDRYAVMSILRTHSPLLSKARLQLAGDATEAPMKIVRSAVFDIMAHFENDNNPSCGEVLRTVRDSGLFAIPEDLLTALALRKNKPSEKFDDIRVDVIEAWQKLLDVRFSEIPLYKEYVEDRSPFGTHQGVKGLEFPRVMVIADDTNQRFKGMISYDKLLNAKPPSETDEANASAGKETVHDRTRRLLYVTCTRAENALALVIYSDKPDPIKKTLMEKEWFMENEIFTNIS